MKIENKKLLSFPVVFEKTGEVSNEDERFTKVKVWLMHLGENLNGSVFEKNIVDDAIDTLAYIPIVGFIEKNDNNEEDFSDHRNVLVKDENGLRRKYMGNAYGVVKSNDENNAHYEDRVCEDGETRTFLVVDGLIWNMFEESSEIINKDLIKGQSMELWDGEDSIDGYEDENGLFHFTKFSFRASCILGEDYIPAMTGSTVEVQFTMNDFVSSIQSELNNKFTAYTKIIDKQEKNQGGIEGMKDTDFTQTVMNQFDDISNVVREHESVTDRWGDTMPRYYLRDIQEDEVITVDRVNNYQYYGMKFTMENDKPVIDFSTAVRKKVRYENYEDGSREPENAFSFGSHINEIETKAFEKVETANASIAEAEQKIADAEQKATDAETNYNTVKTELDEIKPKYENYVNAEKKQKEKEISDKKDSEFAKYENVLGDCEEFTAIKEKKNDMTIEQIESECAILYARKNLGQSNFSAENRGTARIIEDNGGNENVFVSARYGNIRVGQHE